MPDFEYVNNPELNYITKYRGNKFLDGRFYNEKKRNHPEIKDVLQWKMEGNPQKEEKKNDDFRLNVINNKSFINKPDDMVVWLGHASFFIRINGVNILTDPCFGDMYFIKRLAGLPCDISNFINIDYILLSHAHRDHFDVPTLKELVIYNPEVKFLCPLQVGSLIKSSIGNFEIEEAGWYQQFSLINKVDVVCLPSIHWNKRGIIDFNNQLWGSFWFQRNGFSLYFGGDSAMGTHYNDINNAVGNIDVAILGIGAYSPALIMKSSHTNPSEAVEACNILNAKYFIPMHYATYDLSDEPISEPIRLTKEMSLNGKLNAQLLDLNIGEEWCW